MKGNRRKLPNSDLDISKSHDNLIINFDDFHPPPKPSRRIKYPSIHSHFPRQILFHEKGNWRVSRDYRRAFSLPFALRYGFVITCISWLSGFSSALTLQWDKSGFCSERISLQNSICPFTNVSNDNLKFLENCPCDARGSKKILKKTQLFYHYSLSLYWFPSLLPVIPRTWWNSCHCLTLPLWFYCELLTGRKARGG